MIKNNINGKIYIGQSVHIHERWSDHKRIAQNEPSVQYPIYLAMRKYGIENFTFSIIEECPRELLDEREKYWISFYHSCLYDDQNNGYNITFGGNGNQQISNEQIQQIVTLWNEGKTTGEIEKIVKFEKHSIINYLKLYSNYTPEEGDRRGRINNGISHRKLINVYDQNCVFIKQYNGYQAIIDELNISKSNISHVVGKNQWQYKGYYLLDDKIDQKQDLLERLAHQNPKQILLLNNNGTIKELFSNLAKVKEYLKRDKADSVIVCCQGKTKTAYGKSWMYLYNYILQNGFDYTWIKDATQRKYAIEHLK